MCAHLEAETDWIVSRQLGAGVHAPGNRVMDVVGVVPGREFDARAALTSKQIPDAAIDSDVGPGRARYWKDCFDRPGEYVRSVVDRAIDIGFFERERRGGRTYIRQTARYPDWFGRLVGIENKPDLENPGALATQLRKDVSLGLLDEVVLATESYVTRAHLNRIPDAVGVWRVDWDAPEGERVTVVREAAPLSPDEPGVEIIEERPARTDVRAATAAEKARARRKVAERAYGKGWRTYEFPACGRVREGSFAGSGGLPYCEFKDRVVNPANCGSACPGYEEADPPAVAMDAERDARTPWVASPDGQARRQSGLDNFN